MSLHYLAKYCNAQELSETSCHARLGHSKQLLKKFSTVILALFSSLTKRKRKVVD